MDYIFITKSDNTVEKMEAVTIFNISNSDYNYIIYKSLKTGDYYAGKYLGDDISDLDTNLEDEKYLKGSDKLARIRLAKKTMYNNVVRVRPGESYKGYIVFRNNFRQRGDCTLNLPLLYNNGNVAEEFEFNYQLTKKRQ